ncbi:target of rapamycin complex 2 subunit MAPKAP1-like isoform X2 [Oscarella lobularis]|uniref:target of rapamycin complex 2 subunit MAPKAP1-like isoform X2 n=1 Tax=Oscarella lobularis TaxID=121494 RepID=UPI003313A0C0
MAFFDNPRALISQIRHACVTNDETGPDESDESMLGGRRATKEVLLDTIRNSGQNQSFEIPVSTSSKKSNAKKREQTKTIRLQDQGAKPNPSRADIDDLFQPVLVTSKKSSVFSSLAFQLEEDDSRLENPFADYSRHDGEKHEGAQPVKWVAVFLTMLDDAKSSIKVCVLESASVQDFIGLILYKYNQGRRQRLLEDDLSSYALHIAEEDGEIDPDFPALDVNESISKFGFPCLGLVQKNISQVPKKTFIVSVNVPKSGSSKISFDDGMITMREVLARVIKRRRLMRTGNEYTLETVTHRRAVNLDSMLRDQDILEFQLVKSDGLGSAADKGYAEHSVQATLTSHQYKSYKVSMLQKLKNTEVQLGISGEQIEVDPLQTPRPFWSTKPKAVSYDFGSIVWCEIVEEKHATGRSVFQFVHDTGSDFKSHSFEALSAEAREIVIQVNSILETTANTQQREKYQKTLDEKKREKRTVKGKSALL